MNAGTKWGNIFNRGPARRSGAPIREVAFSDRALACVAPSPGAQGSGVFIFSKEPGWRERASGALPLWTAGSLAAAFSSQPRWRRIKADRPRWPDPGGSHPAPWQRWTMPKIQTGRRRSHALRQQGCLRKAAAGLPAVQRGGPLEPIPPASLAAQAPTPWRKSKSRFLPDLEVLLSSLRHSRHGAENPAPISTRKPMIQHSPDMPAGDKVEHSPAILSVNQ